VTGAGATTGTTAGEAGTEGALNGDGDDVEMMGENVDARAALPEASATLFSGAMPPPAEERPRKPDKAEGSVPHADAMAAGIADGSVVVGTGAGAGTGTGGAANVCTCTHHDECRERNARR
jgi:hypothetical protein